MSVDSALDPAGAPAAPASAWALALAFNRLALQGFGGVLPVAQRELVERLRWLTKAQFVELLALGQVLPGPNIVNVALIFGDRCFGVRGALAAAAGLLAAPLAIVLVLAALYAGATGVPQVAGALRGMGIVAAGLVFATAWKLLPALAGNPLPRGLIAGLAVGGWIAVGVLRWPLVIVLPLLGGAGVAAAWWRIGR
jgi:chromate transporter